MNRNRIVGSLFLLVLALNSCHRGESYVRLPTLDRPFEKLSKYNLFVGDLAALSPSDGVLPYDLNTPLFTDYAHKARFVWMPEGKAGEFVGDEVLNFPTGTILIKNFYYQNDERDTSEGRRLIETRLLIHYETEWKAYTYVWNDDQNEALLKVAGDIKQVSWIDRAGEAQNINYLVPNKNQCKSCHSYDNKLIPIGPKAANLNKDYTYKWGVNNQIDQWIEHGYLSSWQAIDTLGQYAQWDNPSRGTLHQRALAYLDVNCGHCHNPHGAGGTTGLNLVYDADIDLSLGINKPIVAAGRASGGRLHSIVVGHPDQSVLLYRMQSTETGVAMPELGRTMVHKEGVQLIEEWISKLAKKEEEH